MIGGIAFYVCVFVSNFNLANDLRHILGTAFTMCVFLWANICRWASRSLLVLTFTL